MKNALVLLVGSLLISSLSQARTIECSGVGIADEPVSITVDIEGSNASVKFVGADYENSWEADDVKVSKAVNGIRIQVSSGSRSEYYADLNVIGSKGTLSYDENDSGWEYSVKADNLKCK